MQPTHRTYTYIKVTLEQQLFELHWSTYTWIVSINMYYSTTQSTIGWIQPIQRDAYKIIGGFSTAGGKVDAPKPRIVQGSTVITCGMQLYYSEINWEWDTSLFVCFACVYVCIYIHVCVYIYIYTHTSHIYIHIHIDHIYIYSCVGIYGTHTYIEREREEWKGDWQPE